MRRRPVPSALAPASLRHRASRLVSASATVGMILGAVAIASPVAAEPRDYRIDPEHVAVGFLVHHIGYADTLGQFLDVQGSFTYDEVANTVSDIRVTIQADSVFTNHERRDNHVRGGDFLNAEVHPEITFVGTDATRTSDTTGTVTGDLTILGETRPVTLEVTRNKIGPYPFGDSYVLGVSARGTVTRSAFGMTYAVDNGWVGDEIELIIEVEAIRQ